MTYRSKQRRFSRRQALQALLLTLSGCGAPSAASVAELPVATAQAIPPAVPTVQPLVSAAAQRPAEGLFSGAQALKYALAQMEFVPRHTGSQGWQQCGDYIVEQLKLPGWEVEEQRFPYKGISCRNIIGKKGSGPVLIIGAHYDSRRLADQDPDPARRSLAVPAANDGASGVAVLLELARVLDPAALGRTIWLTAFDAEDNGGLDGWEWIVGSTYMAKHLTVAPQGMVLVDMIGDADQQIYYERNSNQDMMTEIWKIANELGYRSFVPQPRHQMIDDHIPFVQKGIPAVDLIDFDYLHWHRTSDTVDKISAASLEAVGQTIEQWLLRDAPGLPPPNPANQFLPFIAHCCGGSERHVG